MAVYSAFTSYGPEVLSHGMTSHPAVRTLGQDLVLGCVSLVVWNTYQAIASGDDQIVLAKRTE